LTSEQIWKSAVTAHFKLRGRSYNEAMAKTYNASNDIWKDAERRVKDIRTEPEWTVLDIGPGPGNMAIPLAKLVRSVCCVEPSPVMVNILRKNMDKFGVKNIKIIESFWEDTDIEQLDTSYDIVIASYCLTMVDILPNLKKIKKLADKRVYFYWFDGETSWDRMKTELYPRVHNEEYVPLPKVDLLIELLREIGIEPELKYLNESTFPRSYTDMASAVKDIRQRLFLETNEFDDELKKYIEENCKFIAEGILWEDNTKYVRLLWEK
jgi:SAM-dependent methyltransferase